MSTPSASAPRDAHRPRRLARYLATLFVGTVAPLVLLAAVLIYNAASSERDTVQRSMVDVARTLSAAVDSEIGRTKLGLQVLAMSPSLDSGNVEAFRREAEAARALHGRWSNVGLVRIDGTRLLNLRVPRGQPIPAGNDDTFVEAARRGESLVSDLRTSPTSSKLLVYVSVPVIRDGKPLYALAATMESDLWTEWLKTQVPQGAIAAIDDRAGVIFARSERPEAFVGRTAADPLRSTYASQAEGVVRIGNLEGATLYAAFHTSATTGWHSLIMMPTAVVNARLNRSIALLAAASLAVIALAFLAAFVVARPLRTAIKQVKEAITKLGRGERPPARALPIAELDEAHRAAEVAGELVRSAQSTLEAADRQKDAFLAMLAHELRNPLAPIANACELLARALPAEPDAQRTVGMVRRQVAQLTRLVDDLLDVSRIRQGRVELRRQTLDVADVVNHAVETVEPLVREKRHTLSVATSQRRLFVHGDLARLVQCVVNVLNNAAKFTEPGGALRIETRPEGEEAVIAVSDNGPGISAELLPHVFDLFVQGDRTLDRSQGGLGVGLSVVQQLVQRHGGRVTASSAGLGRGSTFEIRLPLAPAPAPVAEAPPAPSASPRRVLIVDDNTDAADSLALVLKHEGHDVAVAYGSLEALERFDAFEPEVVFLDIGLPGIDGYEVARRIRGRDNGHEVRLVALTGYGQSEDIARARAAGFDQHIVKPVDMNAVLRVIAAAEATA